ncbi:Mth938-like domain-containing protein [Limoniibacter endophyticus]|uniref:Membrane protein n=1 Tax=Limoniibacter endophyticus TaxID=1565040 RepID=A0A8J3DP81_9HYPH|nr:Mth938-like domain-containing protein [Limoniibacter endophyticus]GHC62758.1 membrane protein [Limoniibacter endophyticus]
MEQNKGILIREAHFPGKAPIEAYGNGGFRFADMSHKGSILCLPSGVHGWKVQPVWPVEIEDLSPIIAEKAEIEFLLVGTGKELMPIPRAMRVMLKEHGLSADPMSTGAAVRTYNVLLAEERRVAAALIAVDEA